MVLRRVRILFCCGAMKLKDVMLALEARSSEPTRRILLKHGAREPFFGVNIADMKLIAKRLKGDQALALELYATGNGDAQYLAGMVADGAEMSRKELRSWAASASWRMISSSTVPWVASEHPDGWALALDWIDAKKEHVAIAGWATLGAWVTTHADADLDLKTIGALLNRVGKAIHGSPDRVRQQMNYFVIAVGTYVGPLAARAIATARKVGKIEVDVGDTDCQIPDAESYIIKSRRGAPVAPKRRTMRC
ncbi:MAG: DNA alkylation repair protein [Opitutus sp.]|nr:DNA alkylation repair protein [Opitutus sp.]